MNTAEEIFLNSLEEMLMHGIVDLFGLHRSFSSYQGSLNLGLVKIKVDLAHLDITDVVLLPLVLVF